jgi:hypothetical protein
MRLKKINSLLVCLVLTTAISAQSDSILIPLQSANGAAEITFTRISADIEIRTTTSDTIKILGKGNPRAIKVLMGELDFKLSGNKISLTSSIRTSAPGFTFIIFVPRHISIKIIDFFSQKASIDGVNGDINIKTSGGNFSLTNCIGNIESRTVWGNMIVESHSGSVLGYSDQGSISVSLKKISKENPVILESVFGAVNLNLYKNAKASFRIRAEEGKFETNFTMQPIKADEFPLGIEDKWSIYRAINGGGTPIYLKTSQGKIKITSN